MKKIHIFLKCEQRGRNGPWAPTYFLRFDDGNKWTDTTPFYHQDETITFATRKEAEERAKVAALEYCDREYFGHEIDVVAIPD
jgi:ribonuclease HI